jgi:hypothetical protein
LLDASPGSLASPGPPGVADGVLEAEAGGGPLDPVLLAEGAVAGKALAQALERGLGQVLVEPFGPVAGPGHRPVVARQGRLLGGAAPGPPLRFADQRGAQRVLLDVPEDGAEVLVGGDDEALVAALVEVAFAGRAAVRPPAADVGGADPLDEAGEGR